MVKPIEGLFMNVGCLFLRDFPQNEGHSEH
jgi:hypothetical protein